MAQNFINIIICDKIVFIALNQCLKSAFINMRLFLMIHGILYKVKYCHKQMLIINQTTMVNELLCIL